MWMMFGNLLALVILFLMMPQFSLVMHFDAVPQKHGLPPENRK
jgi:hypothetical protein